MTACRCERCCPEDPAPTYTRAFLIECLARNVAALPTLEERRAWLDRWYRRHGKASTEALKAAIARVWNGLAEREDLKAPTPGEEAPASAITPTAVTGKEPKA